MKYVHEMIEYAPSVAATASLATSMIALFAYLLARKNLSFTADKHDRETVSLVFKSLHVKKYYMIAIFMLYNRAKVDLLIENVEAKTAQKDHGWKIAFHTMGTGNLASETSSFEWTHEGRNIKYYSENNYKALTISPGGRMQIKCEILMHEKALESLYLGKVKAYLCYNGATSKEYKIVMPHAPDIIRILEAQHTVANNTAN